MWGTIFVVVLVVLLIYVAYKAGWRIGYNWGIREAKIRENILRRELEKTRK